MEVVQAEVCVDEGRDDNSNNDQQNGKVQARPYLQGLWRLG